MPSSNGVGGFRVANPFATQTKKSDCPTARVLPWNVTDTNCQQLSGEGGSFLERIYEFRSFLIDFGSAVRDGQHLGTTQITRLVRAFSYFGCGEVPLGDEKIWNAFACLYSHGLKDVDLGNFLACWRDASAYVTGSNPETLLSLHAARKFVEYLDTVAVHFGRSRGYHDGNGMNIGGSLGLISLGFSEGGADDRFVQLSQSIRALIVPSLRLIDYIISLEAPLGIPGIGEIINAVIHNSMNDDIAKFMLRMHGVQVELYDLIIQGARTKPQITELFEIRNRELIDNDGLNRGLRNLGFTDGGERQAVANLRNKEPGPSDLVRFAVRHVFEPDLLSKYGFNAERNFGAFRLDAYHHAAGLDYPIFTGPLRTVVERVTGIDAETLAADYTNRNLPEPTWAHAYWWAHWQIPPASMAAEFWFRLSPTRDKSLEEDWVALLSYDDQNFNDQLRLNDYPPYYRNLLKAVSYRPPEIRWIRRMVAQDQLDEDQVISQLKQLRLAPKVARRMARAIILDEDDRKNAALPIEKGVVRATFRAVLKAYEIGTLSYINARQWLLQIGLTEHTAEFYLTILDSNLRADRVKKVIATLKTDYMEGIFDIGQVQDALRSIGVVQERINDYVGQWTVERTYKVKIASTEKLLSWVGQGIIDIPTFILRMGNLGWIQPDLLGYLIEGEMRIAKREKAIQTASLKSARANATAITKLLVDARKQVKQYEADLRRLMPVGRLIKWARQGTISEQYFESHLRAQGYTDESVGLYWQEVLKDGPLPKTRANATTVSGATGGTSSTSTGAT